MSDGGEVAIRTMSSAARHDDVDIRTGYRVQRVIRNERDEIVGVEASGASGKGLTVRARKAVIFATGGFTHDVEMRKNFLSAPVLGGCAAVTNEGDFVNIGASVGAQLRNMNYAWMCPIVLEKALKWRTPYQVICEAWTKVPAIFKINPRHLIPGPHSLAKQIPFG